MRIVTMMGASLRIGRVTFVLVTLLCLGPRSVPAQEPDGHDHHHMDADAIAVTGWTVMADANVIYGYNYQQRKFADFWALESQNWGMLAVEHAAGPARVRLHGMLSLEPFTIAPLGSPQVFQTGESYQRAPLVNYQHPHDLFMDLGATFRLPARGVTYVLETDLVGAPALGPQAFMHRESARDNPQAPLTHHYMDSTHISAGVVTGGIETRAFTFEASTFRGEENDDDNRLNIETPRLDSWSGRLSWHQGPWQAPFSGGHLKQPEWWEQTDVVRLTASLGYDGLVKSRPLVVLAAWGQNREYTYAPNGYLIEWDLRFTDTSTLYGRGENMRKEIFGLGPHPPGVPIEPIVFSQIAALTFGYVYDLPKLRGTRLGIGADITVYKTDHDLAEYYGSPHSYHVFLRWRPSRSSMAHMH
jgi:hypothetical protein